MAMKNPPHPGRIVRNGCLVALGLSVTEAAQVLGVTRQTLNNIVNGKSSISPDMAIRLSEAFGSTPEQWLRLQASYDLAKVRREEKRVPIPRYRPNHSYHLQE